MTKNSFRLCSTTAITIPTINFLICFWLKREFGYIGAAIRTLPIALMHRSLKIASTASILTSPCPMTITTVQGQVSGWLKWKLGYSCSTFAAFPIALIHLSLKRIVASFFKYHDNEISQTIYFKINTKNLNISNNKL